MKSYARNFVGDFHGAFLPYCVERRPDGRWIVLNRDYKPLGMLTRDFVDYDEAAYAFYLDGYAERKLRRLDSEATLNRVYLYHATPTASAAEWGKYSKKLQILSKLKVSTIPITKAQEAEETKHRIRAHHVAEAIEKTGCTAAEAEERYRLGAALLHNKEGGTTWTVVKGHPPKLWRD